MHKNKNGFTIVELLIVIVIIGILAAITIVAYNGIQMRGRDAERSQDMADVQKVLELYFANNGAFPATNDLANPTWRKANLPSQGEGIFINPQDTNAINSFTSSGSTVAVSRYSYYSLKKDNTLCTTGETDCTQYRLGWRLESDPTVLLSRNIVR